MANPDFEYTEGFDKYGPTGILAPTALATALLQGEWNTIGGSFTASVVDSLLGPGNALQLQVAVAAENELVKTLPASYARHIGGVTFKTGLVNGQNYGVARLSDTGTTQISIGITGSGNIQVLRGAFAGTSLGISAESVAANSVHCIEWDITIHNTTGIVKVWLDGVLTSLNLTGQNTRASANNSYNQFILPARGLNGSTSTNVYDHLYGWCYTASGGTETPALTNPIVETQVATGDNAIAFLFGAGVFGQAYQTSSATNAPGANQLALRKFTATVAGTVSSIDILPAATSATAKFKPVMYADSAGAAGALLSTGAEVVGCTSGTKLNLPLTTPQAIVAGTQYWIGYITDTSIVLSLADGNNLGYKAANTYTSGAPGPAPAMTSAQSSWLIYGRTTGVATNWDEVSKNPALGDLSYVQSSNVGDEDLFNFPSLSSTPSNIYTVAIKVNCARSDAGARTIKARIKSGATTGDGSAASLTPPTTYGWVGSYFRTDPSTGVTWTPTGVNNCKPGYKIAT